MKTKIEFRVPPTFLIGLAAGFLGSCATSPNSLELGSTPEAWAESGRGDGETYQETVNILRHGLASVGQRTNIACKETHVCKLHPDPAAEGQHCFCIHSVGKTWADKADINDYIGLPSALTLTFAAIYEGLRYIWVEDADTLFRSTRFSTLVLFDREMGRQSASEESFALDDEFEIVLRFLAVDNFTEGRLRDELGGDGGELNLVVSLNALNKDGELVRGDTDLLLREEVRRKSLVLAVLNTTEKGREVADGMESFARKAADLRSRARARIAQIRERMKATDRNGRISDSQRSVLYTQLEGELQDSMDELLKHHKQVKQWSATFANSGANESIKAVADIWKTVSGQTDTLEAAFASALPKGLTSPLAQAMATELEQLLVQAEIKVNEEATSAVNVEKAISMTERQGDDEVGLYEKVEVVQGLADSDHSWELEAENVRPSVLRESGTAAVIWCENPNGELFDSDVVREGGVIFRGRLSDLSDVGESTNGFALSVLLMERDDDKFVQSVKLVNEHAGDINVSGIELGPVLDALELIGERIADDDVELRAIDLRFLAGDVRGGASSAREIFRLKPCTVLLGRNCEKLSPTALHTEFGAVAVIQVRRVREPSLPSPPVVAPAAAP
mgnify:CR=1 FL=1